MDLILCAGGYDRADIRNVTPGPECSGNVVHYEGTRSQTYAQVASVEPCPEVSPKPAHCRSRVRCSHTLRPSYDSMSLRSFLVVLCHYQSNVRLPNSAQPLQHTQPLHGDLRLLHGQILSTCQAMYLECYHILYHKNAAIIWADLTRRPLRGSPVLRPHIQKSLALWDRSLHPQFAGLHYLSFMSHPATNLLRRFARIQINVRVSEDAALEDGSATWTDLYKVIKEIHHVVSGRQVHMQLLPSCRMLDGCHRMTDSFARLRQHIQELLDSTNRLQV